MQGCDPVIVITIVEAVPLKRATTLIVARKAEKERGPIQAMPGPELGQLFGGRLIAERGDRRIARHQLNQESHQRNDRPHHQHEKADAAQHSKQFVFHFGREGVSIFLTDRGRMITDSRRAGLRWLLQKRT